MLEGFEVFIGQKVCIFRVKYVIMSFLIREVKMKDAILKAFETYLDRPATQKDMEGAFTFACGYAAGQDAAAKRRELKLIPPSEEIVRYLEGVTGVLEANSYETLAMWREKSEHFVLEQVRCGGYLQTIAKAEDNTTVCLSIQLYTLNGEKILVVEATSRYVDYELVDKWLKKYMPETAFKDDNRLNKYDAMNAGNLRVNR
jgi:Zn ribbon nucleic-acid-binding protein